MSDPFSQLINGIEQHLLHLKEEGVKTVEVSPATLGELGTPPRYVAAGKRELAPPVSSGGASSRLPSDLQDIAKRVAACTACRLCKSRTNVVPGQGNPHPEIMFVGEGPGQDEDEQGLAFVGRAGQLLTRIITRMGLTRDEVFIGNVVKCRPPDNRTPNPDEMAACLPFLREQIALLKPKVIVCLGATAIKGLFGPTVPGITKLRGTWKVYEGIDTMPTFHPSFLLRGGGDEKARYWEVWSDMEQVLKKIGRTPPTQKKN